MHTTESARAAFPLWAPPSGLNSELIEAGVHWDALKAPAYLGDGVLARLGGDCGAVIRDPYACSLYWLIRTGSAASWRFPDIAHVQMLGAASWVGVPPRDRVCSAGLHWARPPAKGRLLTDPAALHDALTLVVDEALGPRTPQRVAQR